MANCYCIEDWQKKVRLNKEINHQQREWLLFMEMRAIKIENVEGLI